MHATIDRMNRSNGKRAAKNNLEGLRAALDSEPSWPLVYIFKFIVPGAELNHLLALLDGLPHTLRDSKSGRFTAVTLELEMESSDSVIAIYQKTAVVKGLMAL